MPVGKFCSWRDKLSFSLFLLWFTYLKGRLAQEKPTLKYNFSPTDMFYIRFLRFFFAGLKGVAVSTSPWVWGEPSTFCSCWENGGQTHNPAQQHSANFALKCPRWRTSGQVGGLPLQSCPWRSFRWGIDEPDWTQEEPVVDTLETPQPSSLPLLCIEHTLLEITLPWHFFIFPYFFLYKDHWVLCHFKLIFLTTQLLFSLSPSLCISQTCTHTQVRTILPSNQCHWLVHFISQCF